MGALTHQHVMGNWCKNKVMPLAPVDDWWKCRRTPMWYNGMRIRAVHVRNVHRLLEVKKSALFESQLLSNTASQMMKIKSNRHWNGNNLSDILCSSTGEILVSK